VSEKAQPLAEAMLRGCAANVGPLIGLDLEVGEPTLETHAELPEGDLAVLPMSVEFDDQVLCGLTVSSPLQEIATLARRLLDDDDPDKEREINEDEVDAIGEVLNLMSGAIDQSIREHINPGYRSRPLSWWRSDQPGDNSLPDGEHVVASGRINIPSAGSVCIVFRISPKLFGLTQQTTARRTQGHVLLLGLEEAVRTSISGILAQAQVVVDSAEPGDDALGELLGSTEAIFLSGDQSGGFELVRNLRLAHDTWQIPSIICLAEPTKSSVMRALHHGATYVMAVPADEISLLRVLRAARPDER